VEADGELRAIVGKKLQALVAYLAVEPRNHSRDELAALLWGDMSDERARHNLRQTLSKLRKVLDEALAMDGDRVQFDRDLCTCDVHLLEDAIADGELETASTLMEQELLEGLATREDAFDDWLRGIRGRLRKTMCSAIDAELKRRFPDGVDERAEGLIRRRLDLDPACEHAHRALMKIAWQSGRRVDAIRQYEICAEALRDELGVTVSPETDALLEKIRSGGPPNSAVTESPALTESPAATEAAAQTSDTPSIAVMAFENLAGDEDRYFTDGMSEDITTGLSCFGSLEVIARQSTFRLRDSELSVRQIGERLGARYIVQGSVRRAQGRVRINVQLVDATTERHVWAQRFDHEVEDIFLVQDEVVSTLVSTLAGRVEAARAADVRRMPAERLDAYERVLRGKLHHHEKTVADCHLAIAHFEQAIERDADYALGHAWLACGLGQALGFRLADRDELLARAHAAAERGRTLDDSESECHRILGQVALLRHELPQSVNHSARAVELNPNDDRCLAGLGDALCFVGRSEEGVVWLRRAIRLNPFHPQRYWSHLARGLFHQGEFAEAFSCLAKISDPRVRERAYALAAAAHCDDSEQLERARQSLKAAATDFDARRFVDALPYDDRPSQEALFAALSGATR
jgi:adenylate cyclase